MKTGSSLLVLTIILLLSITSATLLYFYVDPERNLVVAYATMGIALSLASMSIISMILYFIKRVYYRGIVTVSALHASIRQGCFVTAGLVGLVAFQKLGILNLRTGGLIFFILFLFELMIQSLSEET